MITTPDEINLGADAAGALHRQLKGILDHAFADMAKAEGFDDDMIAAAAHTVCALLASTYLVRSALVRTGGAAFLDAAIAHFARSVATSAVMEYRTAIQRVGGLN